MSMPSSNETATAILALDIGSSSIRCTAYQMDDLSVIASHSIQQRCVQPGTGSIDNVQGILKAVDQLVEQTLLAQRIERVIGVGFSTFCMNLVGVDEHGMPVGKEATLSYAHQSQQVNEEVAHLKDRLLDEEKQALLYKRTGAPIHASYALPQLRVLYAHDATMVSRVHSWQTLASLCLCRWTGVKTLPISYSEASWTGLLNTSSCRYDPLILELLPTKCRDALPPLVDYDGSSAADNDDVQLTWEGNHIAERYTSRWNAMRGARLLFGLGDGACANIGSKCCTIERIAITVGTSAAARVCLPLPLQRDGEDGRFVVEPGLFCYRINSSHVLVGGALTDGGSVVEWIAQLLNLGEVSSEAFQSCLKATEQIHNNSCESSPAAATTTVIPFLSGERSTGFRTGATGAMIGLTRETRPEHLLHGCLVGVTLRIHAIVSRIMRQVLRTVATPHADELPCIVCSGKALEVNDLWRQMLADCSGCETVLDRSTHEGTSRGVAIMVRMSLRGVSAFDDREDIDRSCTFRPRPTLLDFWKQQCEAQEKFLDCVSPLYH